MSLLSILNPWDEIKRLRARLADAVARDEVVTASLAVCWKEIGVLNDQIAKFDHDSNEKPGGSKKKAAK